MGLLDRLGGDGDATMGRLAAAFRKERDGMQARAPARPELTPEEERAAAMAEPLAHGAVDPTTLLTFDDVEAYTGDHIRDSIIGFSPSFVSVAFNGVDGTYRLASVHGGVRGRRWNAVRTWKQLIDGYDDVTEVDDLGDAAFRTGPFTVVRCGDVIIFAEVLRADLGPEDLVATAAVLLRGALANVPSAARRSG